jgi:predicted permease
VKAGDDVKGTVPRLDRVLLALVRGEGSEFVVGDVLEGYARDLREGMTPRAARRRLRRQTLATVVRWWTMRRKHTAPGFEPRGGGDGMRTWWRDARLSVRSLARRPGLAIAVLVTLGIGIGATSTIYSVVDAVLLRPLPYDDPGRLVLVGNTFPRREWDDQEAGLQHLAGVSVRNWEEYRSRLRSLVSLEALEYTSILLPDRGDGPELVSAANISEGFLDVLGVTPVLGRTFLPSEHLPGAPPALLLSYGTWMRRFGGDPSVVGQAPEGFGGTRVVGVLPRGFRVPEAVLPSEPDFWRPMQPADSRYESRGRRSLALLARLAPGSTLDRARTEAREVARDVARAFPDGNVFEDGEALGLGANDLKDATVGASRRVLLLFLAAAGLLLLIAGLNAATLLLARTLERSRELGVRAALGAGGGTIVRLLLTESLLLAIGGGLLGAVLAFAGVDLVHRYGPSSIPRLDEIALDARVLAATSLTAVLAGLLVGLVPALRHVRRPPGLDLRAGRSGTEGGVRLRDALVVAQVAVAVVMLSAGGLLLNSFVHLRAVDPGFDPEGLLTLRMDTKRPGAADIPWWQDWDAVLAAVAGVPGVRTVAGTSNPPFQSPFWAPWVRLPDEGVDVRESFAGYAVTPGYFDVVGTHLLEGRGFTAGDGPDGPFVAIVNESWVRARLGGREAVGQLLRFTDDEERMVTVVGVVEDVIQDRAQDGRLPAVYVPYTQTEWPFVQVVARLDLPAATVVPEVRRALAGFNPYVPPRDVRMMDQRMAATRSDPRFQALLISAFAALALLLASAGLYGSLSHAVSRRRREMGIRVALGAARRGLVALVVGHGLRLSAAGVVLGLIGAASVTRLLGRFLYGVTPRDPLTYVSVVTVLGAVAALASFVPARRATAVDPVEVLNEE